MKTATVQELAQALPQVTLIDVREAFEFAGGHIDGAQSMPLSRLDPAALPDGELWLVCRSGSRSAQAGARLEAAGRTVVNVQGGLGAWRAAGLPVVGASPRGLGLPLIASLTLGLAPFTPEPHLVGKLRWVAGGAQGMAGGDWFDLVLHGAPWIWLGWTALSRLRARR